MFFLDQQKDTALYQELVREGVLTASLWGSLQLPSEGHLMDVLIGNRAKIPSKPWINWLVRNYDCTRIPGLDPDPSFIKALPRPLVSSSLKTDCYALQEGRNHIYIGIGRPDNLEQVEAISAHFKKETIYRNALSIEEIAFLRNICKETLQSA